MKLLSMITMPLVLVFSLVSCSAPSLFVMAEVSQQSQLCFDFLNKKDIKLFLKTSSGENVLLKESLHLKYPQSLQVQNLPNTVCEEELGEKKGSFANWQYFEENVYKVVAAYLAKQGLNKKVVANMSGADGSKIMFDVLVEDFQKVIIGLSRGASGLKVEALNEIGEKPTVESYSSGEEYLLNESIVTLPHLYQFTTNFLGKKQSCFLNKKSEVEFICEIPMQICFAPRGEDKDSNVLRLIPEVRRTDNENTMGYLDPNLKYTESPILEIVYNSSRARKDYGKTQCFSVDEFYEKFKADELRQADQARDLPEHLKKIAEHYYERGFNVELSPITKGVINVRLGYHGAVDVPVNEMVSKKVRYNIHYDQEVSHPIPCKQWSIRGTDNEIIPMQESNNQCEASRTLEVKHELDKLDLILSLENWNSLYYAPTIKTDIAFNLLVKEPETPRSDCYGWKKDKELVLVFTGEQCQKVLNPKRIVAIEDALTQTLIKTIPQEQVEGDRQLRENYHLIPELLTQAQKDNPYLTSSMKAYPKSFLDIEYLDNVTKEVLPVVSCNLLQAELKKTGYTMIDSCQDGDKIAKKIMVYQENKNSQRIITVPVKASLVLNYIGLPENLSLWIGKRQPPTFVNFRKRTLWINVNNTGEWNKETEDRKEQWYHVLRRMFTDVTAEIDQTNSSSEAAKIASGRLAYMSLAYYYESKDEIFEAYSEEDKLLFSPSRKEYSRRLLNKPPGYSTNLTAEFLDQFYTQLKEGKSTERLDIITFTFRDPALHSNNLAVRKLKKLLGEKIDKQSIRWRIVEISPDQANAKMDQHRWIKEFYEIAQSSNNQFEVIYDLIHSEKELEQYQQTLLDFIQQY
ncbi:hypothetical protein WDW89_13620 [Deltaproteobacteria bacterium TL4]